MQTEAVAWSRQAVAGNVLMQTEAVAWSRQAVAGNVLMQTEAVVWSRQAVAGNVLMQTEAVARFSMIQSPHITHCSACDTACRTHVPQGWQYQAAAHGWK